MSSLSSLQAGQHATITAINADTALLHRFSALGFRVGKQLEVIRHGIFNGPLHIRIGTTDVIVRKHDAKQIEINLI